MKAALCNQTAMLSLMIAVALLASGCSQQSNKSSDSSTPTAKKDDPSHGGWWCVEHGVPEKKCSVPSCNKKVAADFKAKGDWCEEHNRAESQCFKCDPSRAEKFAKLYEAKFGHVPPKPTE